MDAHGPILGPRHDLTPCEVTFDGGARTIHGAAVAGAGAILWGPRGDDGQRTIMARTRTALPDEPHAQVAEAVGRAAGLRLLLGVRAEHRAAQIIGDNTAVVRHGAGLGRLSRPGLHEFLAAPLAAAAESGWQLTCIAVRRRLNAAADELATSAVRWVGSLRAGGLTGVCHSHDTV